MESGVISDYSNWQHLLGGASALLSAFMWAVAAILFAQLGKQINARTLNLGKGIVASICLLALLLSTDASFLHDVEFTFGLNSFWFLALSGILGITIGDTLYFLTLQKLGAKLTLLVGTLIPVVTALSAIAIFDEQLTLFSALGLVFTILGVTYVLWQKVKTISVSQGHNNQDCNRQNKNKKFTISYWTGALAISLLYVLAESGGILLTKFGLESFSSLEATFIRQIFGVAGLVFWGLAASQLLAGFEPVKKSRRLLGLFVVTSFIGAFLGTWLSILALELTYTSVAVSLNSTSPLFVLPIAYWILKEKITRASIVGASIAVFGVALYFVGLS